MSVLIAVPAQRPARLVLFPRADRTSLHDNDGARLYGLALLLSFASLCKEALARWKAPRSAKIQATQEGVSRVCLLDGIQGLRGSDPGKDIRQLRDGGRRHDCHIAVASQGPAGQGQQAHLPFTREKREPAAPL